MKSYRKELWFNVPARRGYVNITPQIEACLRESGVREGLCLVNAMHITDPLLDIAREVEQAALADDYFASRKLYPNVDFYSGIILRAIGIPVDMFTVMFAIGRTPGWIAHWKEVNDNEAQRIYRPRQVYVGNRQSEWRARSER